MDCNPGLLFQSRDFGIENANPGIPGLNPGIEARFELVIVGEDTRILSAAEM